MSFMGRRGAPEQLRRFELMPDPEREGLDPPRQAACPDYHEFRHAQDTRRHRSAVRDAAAFPLTQPIRTVTVEAPFGSDAGQELYGGSIVVIKMPVDAEARSGRQDLGSRRGGRTGRSGVTILSFGENASILKAFLLDVTVLRSGSSKTVAQPLLCACGGVGGPQQWGVKRSAPDLGRTRRSLCSGAIVPRCDLIAGLVARILYLRRRFWNSWQRVVARIAVGMGIGLTILAVRSRTHVTELFWDGSAAKSGSRVIAGGFNSPGWYRGRGISHRKFRPPPEDEIGRGGRGPSGNSRDSR